VSTGRQGPTGELAAARQEADYYRRLAEEAGTRRLREAEALSQLLDRAQQAERELQRATDDLESRVAVRTAELSAANAHLEMVVAERERAEAALRASEEAFRSFMRHFPGLAYIKEADTRVVFANEGFRALLGLDPAALQGRTNAECFPEPFASKVTGDDLRVLSSGQAERVEEEFAGRTWSTWKFVILRSDGAPRLGGLTLDITDLKRGEEERRLLERQVEQAQRLESLGVMAGGIAHDFNNLLTAILSNVLSLRADAPPAVPDACLADVEAAARTAAGLCQQMLAYAGRAPFTTAPLDLGVLVRDMVQLLRSALSRKLGLDVRLEGGLPLVRGDASQLRQIVMNLVINAAEALREGDGTVTIAVRAEQVGPARLARALLGEALPAGSFVCLEVADTGCGMDPATQRRIFEPFFSSKFTGRGLGLAAVLGAVRQLGGAIEVESAPGTGSRFRVLVPATAGEQPPAAVPAPGRADWAGHGTVLVVDDDAAVRRAARRMLRQLGFEVLEAPGGAEGVEAYRAAAGQIRAVLLDLTMPQVDGVETFHRLRQLDPAVRVLVVSGYAAAEVAVRFGAHRPGGFLQKPFEPESLKEHLQAMLEAPAGGPPEPA